MPNLASTDILIVLIYFFFMLAVGISLKPLLAGGLDFLQAGRALPAWICGLAMTMASLGSQELIGMGAAGARYGFASIPFYLLGALPAMLFAAFFLVPAYYNSKARTLPEFLALRFDKKTRVLHAVLFAAMAAFSAGISLYAMARILSALHVLEAPLRATGLESRGVMILSIALPALLILAYLLLGGLTATIYNLVIQFFVLVAGLLPVVFLSLKQIGGWSGLKAAAGLSESAQTGGHSGLAAMAAAGAMGLVFAAGTWCADFRVLQAAMAAKNVKAARNAPLIAAALRILVPLLVILPAIIALGMETPRTTIVIHSDNGAIYHEIDVVPPEVENGQGLVPAKLDAATGKPLKDTAGHTVLDAAMATPNMLVHFLPTGLLGLGIAVLLASMMAGAAASLTAFATVVTCDLWQIGNDAAGEKPVVVMRWASAAGAVLALGAALLSMRFNSLADATMLLFAVVIAPLLPTLLLGVFWRRTTATGAFSGLIAGAVAALLHHGLAVPVGELRGIHGGWIAVLHHPPSERQFSLGTALIALTASLLVTAAVSAFTKSRGESESAALVLQPAASAPMKMDTRIPLGMMFTLAGTLLAAFGLSTRGNPDVYTRSLGIDLNVWWGFPLMAFGILMLALGRRGQMKMEKPGTKGPREQGNKRR
ncbi:MAG: Na+/galactose cotransporter [Terracidiphilus sp.]